jgi:hypothetical protein
MNANCWGLLNEKLYFGGNDGKVYEADVTTSDNGGAITYELITSFNYYSDRTSIKRMLLIKPNIIANGIVMLPLEVLMDFKLNTTPATTVTSLGVGATWDVDPWDTTPWADSTFYSQTWRGVAGLGRCAAIRMTGTSTNLYFSVSAFNIIFEKGGVYG